MENKDLIKETQETKEVWAEKTPVTHTVKKVDPSKEEIKSVKFNTIISDPDDEHPDSHLWE